MCVGLKITDCASLFSSS